MTDEKLVDALEATSNMLYGMAATEKMSGKLRSTMRLQAQKLECIVADARNAPPDDEPVNGATYEH